MALRFSVIVCAHNEAQHLPACLHSLLAQSRTPDEILVINNASTDATRAVAEAIPHVRVVDEPRKGLVVARETGRLAATGDVLVYVDADCRAPLTWLARIERRFIADPRLIALSGPYRFYDWDWWGRLLIRAYDYTLAPATQCARQVRAADRHDLLRRQLRRQARRRSSASADSTPRSSSMVRTPTSAAGCSPSVGCRCFTTAICTRRRAATSQWGRARSSGSTCATSPRSCCAAGRRTRRMWM